MARLTDFERDLLMSSMADTSVARTLGRSLRWVVRVRGILDVEAEPPQEPVQARVGQSLAVWEAKQCDAASAEPVAAPRRLKAPAIPRRQRARVLPIVVIDDTARARALVSAPKPLKPGVLRWARWFVEADWPLAEVADLFDVPADRLAAALTDAGVPHAA